MFQVKKPTEQSFLKQAGASRLLRPFTNADKIRSVPAQKLRSFSTKLSVNSHDAQSSTWNSVFQHATKNGHANSTVSSTICSGLPNELGDFQLFDPMRTLQFLIGELRTKIKLHMPDNEAVLKIVSEMKCAIKRVVTSNAGNVKICDIQEDKSRRPYLAACRGAEPLKAVNEDIVPVAGVASMPPNDMKKYHDDHRLVTENYKRLQEDFRDLDAASSALRDEKCNIQKQLSLCQDEIICLNKKILHLERILKESANKENATIADLQDQCNRLQSKVKVYEENASSSSSGHQQQNTEIVLVEELNTKLQKSFNKIATLKRSRLENSKQYVSTVLEKEKLSIQLSSREMQIQEIEKELRKIHALVTEQMQTLSKNVQSEELMAQHSDTTNKESDRVGQTSNED